MNIQPILEIKKTLDHVLSKYTRQDKSFEGKLCINPETGEYTRITLSDSLTTDLTNSITFFNGYLTNTISGLALTKMFDCLKGICFSISAQPETEDQSVFNYKLNPDIAAIMPAVEGTRLVYKVYTYTKISKEEAEAELASKVKQTDTVTNES